jgi:class 3 adenylate cyclase
MEPPATLYATSPDGVHIAYQVFGEGQRDLMYVPEFWNSIEAMWEQPRFRRFLERLATFTRVICMDQRGTGLSDPVSLAELPTLEQWADDVTLVLDAAGSTGAALLGSGGGGLVCQLFAATYPERTNALVLINSAARFSRGPDQDWGWSDEFEERILKELRFGWGRGVLLETVAPTVAGDPEFRQWWGRYQRLGSSPGTVIAMRRMLEQLDVRNVLPSIRVPTLVIHRKDNRLVDVAHGRYLANHIAGSRYAEVDGDDYLPFIGDSDEILGQIEEFLTGAKPTIGHDRVLATVLFTDIVGSTEKAAALGDAAWLGLLHRHHSTIRGLLERHRGREVDTAGDGFLATFDGPARAIRCATSIVDALEALDIGVRAGLHTGECELIGEKVGGIAVHIAARVVGLAGRGEVFVSSTVRDLVAGSGLSFEDAGEHELKGVPDRWHLYRVVS